MKNLPFIVAIGGLVGLSAIDLALTSAGIFVLPPVGWWGVICAALLSLSLWAVRVGEQHGRRFKGAYIGFVSPVLASLLGHRGIGTVVILFVPMVVAGVLLWRGRPSDGATA